MKSLFYFSHSCILISLLISVVSCRSIKYVPEGDFLYTGSELQIHTSESKSYIKKLHSEVEKQIRPKPNLRLLGLPLKLNLYSFLGKPKKSKGFKYNFLRKFGEAPVLFSSVNPSYTQKALAAALYNRGFFDAEVTYTIKKNEKKKKANIVYMVQSGPTYRIDTLINKVTDTAIVRIIEANRDKSKIKKGRRYNLDRLKEDRERINNLLKNDGYYKFNPDYLLYQADTSGARSAVSMSLKLKPQTPTYSLRRYTMSEVFVILDSSYTEKYYYRKTDTVKIDHVVLALNKDFNPHPIAQYVYLKDSSYYSRENQRLTVSRLMGMNLFKYVDIQITEVDSSHLSAYIHLSPLPKRSITAETQLVSKSNNFIGPGINLTFTDRNVFKGGEKLSLGFHGSVETQLNGQFKGLYTYEFGPQLSLTFPRFIVPFKVKPSSYFTPNTIFSSSYTFLNRVNYFEMRTLQISFGYKWKETLSKEHYLKPINISYFNIRNLSPDFTSLLNQNPAMRRRYEDQLIVGTAYSYTYNQQVYPNRKNQFYFNGNAEIAGNTMQVANMLLGEPENSNGAKTIASVAYAQYARFDIDLRNYYKTTKRSIFASHFVLGIGVPYGNSKALPFSKAFFSGGANSLRAFPVNSVGPGTYRLPDTLQSAYFIQQGGDIKLELSGEYRFPIVSIIKGAFFVDAGNVWLYRKDNTFPGGEFKMKKAWTELAVGGGFGLRVDLSFFIIRLDLATPFRKPWMEEGKKWVLDDISIGKSEWRKQNLILNIAIGYPF
jgi:outer membrane protein insertion porin family